MPWEGFLVGWRDDVKRRFPPPPDHREPEHRARRRRRCDRRVRRHDPDVRLVLGLRRAEPDRHRSRRRVPRRLGRRPASTPIQPRAHQPGADGPRSSPSWPTMRPPKPDLATLARTVSAPVGTRGGAGAGRVATFGLRAMPSMSARCTSTTPRPRSSTSSRSASPTSSRRSSASPPTAWCAPGCERSTTHPASTHDRSPTRPSRSCRRSRPSSAHGRRSRSTPPSGGRGSTST